MNAIKPSYLKVCSLLIVILLCSNQTFAHAAITDIEKMSGTQTALLYTKLGFEHILPLGLDHIFFILSLFLINPKLKAVMWQASAFTLAHTITLSMSMYNIINPPPAVVEPLIAFSIAYVAAENIFFTKIRKARIGIVFLFGLVHGMGFAGALSELGLPSNKYFQSLLCFNIGVELGQIAVILIAYVAAARWFSNKNWYRKGIVIPVSAVIGITACYWMVERVAGSF